MTTHRPSGSGGSGVPCTSDGIAGGLWPGYWQEIWSWPRSLRSREPSRWYAASRCDPGRWPSGVQTAPWTSIVRDSQTGGVVDSTYGLSVLEPDFDPLNGDGVATAEIFSDATGRTWWVSLEAPVQGPEQPPAGVDADDSLGWRRYRLRAAPGLPKGGHGRVAPHGVHVDVHRYRGSLRLLRAGTVDEGPCDLPMFGVIDLQVEAYGHAGRFTWGTAASMYVDGGQGQWRFIRDEEFVSFLSDTILGGPELPVPAGCRWRRPTRESATDRSGGDRHAT